MILRRRSILVLLIVSPLVLAILVLARILFLLQGGMAPYRIPLNSTRVVAVDAATLERGEYVARIGNCATCHTKRGGTPFTGGRAFTTPYGTIYSTNLTPDKTNGLGDWSVDEFAHTLRHGVSRNGVLYPAFPYAHFALLSGADVDALYVFLRSLPTSSATPPPNALDFPASWRPALIAWRMLYYRPATTAPPSDRGRYLVDGLGHCEMCHSTRGAGGSLPPQGYLAGGSIPGIGWYAPPLDSRQLQRFSVDDLVAYLRTGTSSAGTAYGPMAEVVYSSLHALSEDDARAIAHYLKGVQPTVANAPQQSGNASAGDAGSISGTEVYKRVCADCHGEDGEGIDGKYPPLRDAVAATAPDPINAVRIVLYGALPATTAGNPQPYSMPPSVQHLSSGEIAAVVNHVRSKWGRQVSELTARDVESMYGIVID